MSRLAKRPIAVPAKTEVSYSGGSVMVKGPKGTLQKVGHRLINIEVGAEGVQVSTKSETIEARSAAAADLQRATGATLIHPYDDDRVIAGQGTAALEFLEEIPDLDMICAPVSGGGLLSGTAIAAKSLRPEIQVIGCEPANADDAARSLASGQIEPPAQALTMADGLRATLCARTFAILRERVDRILLVSEGEIVRSMHLITEHLRCSVEPSGAVAAAPALHRQLVGEDLRVGIILSGGNFDASEFRES